MVVFAQPSLVISHIPGVAFVVGNSVPACRIGGIGIMEFDLSNLGFCI
jgi:hypothetical protein